MKIFEHASEDKIIEYLKTCVLEDEIYNCEDEEGNGWLHVYSGTQYSNLQDYILEEWPAIVHMENIHNETAIYYAIRNNNLELVKKIVAVHESVLTQSDINGRTPLSASFTTRWCCVEICEFLWNRAPLQGDFMWYYTDTVSTSFEKSKFLLDNTPGVFDMTFDKGENVLHKTIYVRSVHTKRLIKYIYEKTGTVLFSATDSIGMNAMHHSYTDLVKLIYELYPNAVYKQDMFGNTPLCYSQNNGDGVNPDAIEIMRKHPEILEIQNKNGQTMFMKNFYCPPELFRINPKSFAIVDKYGNTPLHHICSQKKADWWKLVDEVLQVYPKMIFQKNNEKKSSLDIGISKSGYSAQQRSKERFITVCLKYSELPDKYWIFKGISFDLIHSMGHVIDRSRDEAAKAMSFLPKKDREIIQNLIVGMNHIIEPEIITRIISRMYN
jgi:ankyrin repeat protein